MSWVSKGTLTQLPIPTFLGFPVAAWVPDGEGADQAHQVANGDRSGGGTKHMWKQNIEKHLKTLENLQHLDEFLKKVLEVSDLFAFAGLF